MNANIVPLIGSWITLASVVIVLALYRKRVSTREDYHLHLETREAGLVPEQAVVARSLDKIDYWGKMLTVLLVIYGIVLAGAYFYWVWQEITKNIVSE